MVVEGCAGGEEGCLTCWFLERERDVKPRERERERERVAVSLELKRKKEWLPLRVYACVLQIFYCVFVFLVQPLKLKLKLKDSPLFSQNFSSVLSKIPRSFYFAFSLFVNFPLLC